MSASAPEHPLQRLSAAEIGAVRDLLAGCGLVGVQTRFPYLGLEEPPKSEVLAFRPGDPIDRRVRVVLLDTASGAATDVVVSLTSGSIVSQVALDPVRDGQPSIMLEDLIAVDEIVKADTGWVAAMARRDITDLDLVRPCPLAAGSFGLPGEEGRRMVRVLSFLQHRKEDAPWAHPIDGIVAYVDLIERRVIELHDHELRPVPREDANFDDPSYTGPPRTSLRPIEISQPDGPSFRIDSDVVEWEGWRLRIGFDAREALTLHEVSLAGRTVLYRASISEMVVPYADPSPWRFWQSFMDAGEYLLGQQVNSLAVGCDCLGEIRYLDAVLPTEDGGSRVVDNAICLHEEDFGVLWKHVDIFTGAAGTRRQRRLVVSTFVTVGNYSYGFSWYFYLDGTIELEVKATGVLFTSAYVDGSERYAVQVGPGLAAPFHQHLFSARLDMGVDGTANAVDEVDLQRLPTGPDNPYGGAFTRSVRRLRRESEGARLADPSLGRTWHIVNPDKTNRYGDPVGYALYPQGQPVLAAEEESAVAKRSEFASRHLWVTAYDPAERFAAGDFPNQHPGGAGLPSYVAADRSIDSTDIVVWHTFGMTHFPRAEDWPVMPVDRCGFVLKPVGFFDRNPTLDVPGHGAGPHG
jgi:primary-amine oxidase